MSRSDAAVHWITRTALGVALVVVAQLLGKVIPAGAAIAGPFSVTQLVTGSLVNCVLFVFTATTGIWSGVAIGILSSVLATLVGIGPAVPAVTPVIACGNAVLALFFGLLHGKDWQFGRWAFAAVIAAAVKCAGRAGAALRRAGAAGEDDLHHVLLAPGPDGAHRRRPLARHPAQAWQEQKLNVSLKKKLRLGGAFCLYPYSSLTGRLACITI